MGLWKTLGGVKDNFRMGLWKTLGGVKDNFRR
jgi:hypothetical protein